MAAVRKPGQGSEKRKATAYMPPVRMEPADHARAIEALRAAGRCWPEFARDMLLGEHAPRASARRPLLPEEQAIRQLMGQLGYIGNNLNQLTRLANMGDLDDLDDPDELARTREKVNAVLDECMKALGRDP